MALFKRKYRNYYIGIGLMLMVVNFYYFDLLPALDQAKQETRNSYREQIRKSLEALELPVEMGDVIVVKALMLSPDTALCVDEVPDSAIAASIDFEAIKADVIERAMTDSNFGDPFRKGEVTLEYRYEHKGQEIGRVVVTPAEIQLP